MLRCSIVVFKIKLGCNVESRTSRAKGDTHETQPIYSKVLSKTAMESLESRTEPDQRGAVNGASYMELRPAQGGAYLVSIV